MDDEMRRALKLDGEKMRQLTGESHGPLESCPDCAGNHGLIEVPKPRADDPYYCEAVLCPRCGGSGWVEI